MTEHPLYSVSVAGVVVDDAGRVLVTQRRDNAHWEPPGGILEHGETFEQGVVREVLEETGVTVEPERLTGVYKNMRRHIVALVYHCRPLHGEAIASAESRSVRWVDPSEVESLMSPAYAVRVLDALQAVPASRSHDGVNLLRDPSSAPR